MSLGLGLVVSSIVVAIARHWSWVVTVGGAFHAGGVAAVVDGAGWC